MLISFIIATFNSAQTLKQTIESIISQTYTNWELIIIDCLSTDNTIDIIKSYQSEIKYWISEKDTGIYNAWNKGIKVANGDWISFIGSDDYLFNNEVLTNIIPYLNDASSQNIRYVYSKVYKIDPISLQLKTIEGNHWTDYRNKILENMCIPHWGSFHHKNMFKANGFFDESFKISGDYDFLLREFTKNKEALFASDIIAIVVRDGGASGSRKQLLAMAKEQALARKKMD